MTRRGWAFGAAVAVIVTVGLVAILAKPSVTPTAEQRVRAVASELRCPDCAGLSAADSPTQAAAEVRRQVAEQLAAGRTEDEIIDSFVARYGDWIRLTPPGPVPWLIPLLATAAGAGILGWWLLGRRSLPATEPDGTPDAPTEGALATPRMARVRARRLATGAAVVLAVAVAVGYFLPEPISLAGQTVVNEPLAQAQADEAARQDRIERLLGQLQANPLDPAALSDLADAYLAGSTAEDLQRAAVVLIALIGLNPDDPDPYPKLISAYVRAEDWTDAGATTESLANIAPDSADVPFFEGLIAWRGHGDAETAMDAFDRFLAMAPDDGRVPMIRALRQEAAGSE
jgi:cytochrome c-type biogenesis protein CcmH